MDLFFNSSGKHVTVSKAVAQGAEISKIDELDLA
jgi:hypothetical protein